jgi:hypothetical protein
MCDVGYVMPDGNVAAGSGLEISIARAQGSVYREEDKNHSQFTICLAL